MIPSSIASVRGSPPRAWGKPAARPGRSSPPRFTPTRVGKTMLSLANECNHEVHPHARGENRPVSGSWASHTGSPPRAWGKPYEDYSLNDFGTVHPHARGENELPRDSASTTPRFTPTRVGKTATVRRLQTETEVHPHARGENYVCLTCLRHTNGSPPRAWGKRPHASQIWVMSRFTPTRVGKTPARAGRSGQGTVHPHARGENGAPWVVAGK